MVRYIVNVEKQKHMVSVEEAALRDVDFWL